MSHEGFNASRRHVRSPAEVLYLLALALFFAIGIFLIALAASRTAHAAEVGDQWDMTTPPRQLSQLPVTPTGRAWFPDFGAVGGRPSQCPRRYCGCAMSIKLFGRIIPQLNLAANWSKVFPRAQPSPGMVAARRGHVMLILSYVQGRNYLVFDPNSGGGLTREHVRSIAGFTIVNPHRNRWASL